MEKFIEISGQVYKMIGWGWQLDMKNLVDSFLDGSREYYKKYGHYPTYAYMHKDTVKNLVENASGKPVSISLEPPFNSFYGITLDPIENWVQPNLVYFNTEIKKNG